MARSLFPALTNVTDILLAFVFQDTASQKKSLRTIISFPLKAPSFAGLQPNLLDPAQLR